MQNCCFISLDEFKGNEDLEMKVYCYLLKVLRNNCNIFIFQKDKFNDFCYDIVTNFQSCFLSVQRICIANKNDHVCSKEEKSHIESLIKNLTGEIVPLRPYERVVDFSQIYESDKQSKEEFILKNANICVVYSKPENKQLQKLKDYAQENDIKLIIVN